MLGGLKSGVFFAVWISALAAQPALAADCLVAPQPSVTFDGLSTLKDDHRENLSGLACGPASESGRVCLLVQDEGFRFAVPDAQFAEHGVLFGTRPAFRWVGDALVMPESKY